MDMYSYSLNLKLLTFNKENPMTYATEQITTPNGNNFNVEVDYDSCCGAPWEECDGHGDVSGWTICAKKPGELVLCADHPARRYYNFQGAIKKAKMEGWDAEPYTTGTKGERAVRAVMADFNYLKAWFDNKWFYTCLHVVMLDSDGNEMAGYDDYMGGVEYGMDDYWQTVAQEMASEIERRYRADQNAALTAELHSIKDNALFVEGIL